MFAHHYNFTNRLLFFVFLTILVPFLVLTFYLRKEIRADIFEEKQDKLFGLAMQLDHYLAGDFNDILREGQALSLNREQQILFLNSELKDITDFVASGNPGVGVGYYAKDLNAVITYGPSEEFQYTVGKSITEGHEGLIVLSTGEDRVQVGELVRGNIMNCMHPVIREGRVIGYIWANETVDKVEAQLSSIMKRVYQFVFIIFFVIYICVYIISKIFLNGITVLKYEIENLINEPDHRMPQIGGELNIISEKVNELVDSVSFEKSYNRYILDAVVSSVLVVSNDGIITNTNRAFFQLFEHLGEDIQGKASRDVFSEEIETLIEAGLYSNTFFNGREIRIFEKIIKVSSNNVIDEKKRRLGLILIFQDITLIRKYEIELSEKERMAALGEMSLGVVHEIKNPLTCVKGFTQMLQRPILKKEKRMEYLLIMEEELNRVNRLLNELLLYGGQSPLCLQAENVEDIIDCLITEHRTINPEFIIEKAVMQPGDFFLMLDKHKVIQVFENVIKNAVDAVDGILNGKLEIGLYAEEASVSVIFRDNGCGISEENLRKIYNPFFTTKDRGTGFGLPICYRIIKKHGGDIEINSKESEYTEVKIKFNRNTGE